MRTCRGTALLSGLREQAQENHSAASEVWRKSLTSASPEPLSVGAVVVADRSGLRLWEEGDILDGQALQACQSERWIYVPLRQLCRRLCVFWLCVYEHTGQSERRNTIEEGNEIFSVFALWEGSGSCMQSDENHVWIKSMCAVRSAKDNIVWLRNSLTHLHLHLA